MTKLSPQSIGVDVEKLQHNANEIFAAKATHETATADLRNAWKAAEEAGIHKAALKHVLKLKKQDTAAARDFQRYAEVYGNALGLDKQIDMFEQQEGQKANAESVDKASQTSTAEKDDDWGDSESDDEPDTEAVEAAAVEDASGGNGEAPWGDSDDEAAIA